MTSDIPDLGFFGESVESPNGHHVLFFGDSEGEPQPADNKVVITINGHRLDLITVDRRIVRGWIFDNGYTLLDVYDDSSRQGGIMVLNRSGEMIHSLDGTIMAEALMINDSGGIIRRP